MLSTIILPFFLSETCELVEEDENGKLNFLTSFHYQSKVESSTSAVHNPARSRRLAQEISTLASSLPLSPSSSVFVRCDEERLDIMKVGLFNRVGLWWKVEVHAISSQRFFLISYLKFPH